jgi:anti-sigma-K factor RskA
VAEDTIIRPQVPAWRIIARNPINGWVAAAAVLIFSLLILRNEKPLPPERAEQRLRAEAPDLIERKFAGLGDFGQAGGSVIWSDSLQQGYMILKGIPANNPQQAQYQLWIVDPARDADAPVDGGVFDIPRDGSPAVIPIAAKLPLSKPQAFVITLEQPGGVVKSKQEKVVALAKL